VLLPVEAQGSLRLDAPTGRAIAVVADGDTVQIDVPGWPELKAMMPGASRSRSQALRLLSDVLRTYGLKIRFESAGRTFLQLGHGTTTTWLARFLGLAPADLRFAAIRVYFRR
jgi:hypothetical protein